MKNKFAVLFPLFIALYIAPAHAGMNEAVIAYKKGDYAAALQEFRPLAQQGNLDAQIQLGIMYANGQGIPKDDVQAILWMRKAADQGSATAQFNLGLMYYQGQGTPQDYRFAAEWYRKSADQGNPKAQMKLGLMYAEGQGLPQDYTQASAWYRQAAEQGDPAAQNNLGRMYYRGEGIPTDYAQALMWYRKAAGQGSASAQVNLGLAYDEGKGVPQDYAQAATWYRKAADQGDPSGQNNLGTMYYKGQGVPKDHAQALVWYRKAAEGGNVEARNNLSKLTFEQPLSSQEMKTAQGTGISLPLIHNSPDTHCQFGRQCTNAEFVGVLDTLGRQWALVPEWLRARCIENSTYPLMEQCILNQTASWLTTHPGQQAPWINPDNYLVKQRGESNAKKAAEQFDSIDVAVSDCEIKQIATRQHFVIDRRTGSLDLRSAALRVVSACLKQSNAWIEKCIQESGNSEGCTRQSLLIPQMLIKEAWLHRDNLRGWEREASK